MVLLTLRVDPEKLCAGCWSDKFTELDPAKHPHLRWCSLCWDWQKEIPPAIREMIVKGQA